MCLQALFEFEHLLSTYGHRFNFVTYLCRRTGCNYNKFAYDDFKKDFFNGVSCCRIELSTCARPKYI